MLAYAAYLRVYEPPAAFPEPERTAWAEYASSAGRPNRASALQAEQAESLRRLLSTPPVVAPRHESPHAYVRRVDGAVYVCPWQTRLRSWESFSRFRDSLPTAVAEASVPAAVADRASAEFARWTGEPYGPDTYPVDHLAGSACLVRAFCSRGAPPGARFATRRWRQSHDRGAGADTRLCHLDGRGQGQGRAGDGRGAQSSRVRPGLARDRGCRPPVAEFHGEGLVELDYGGLTRLFDERALSADDSVAEVAVALAGMEAGKAELAVAMRRRLLTRWRFVRALDAAN